MEDIKKTLGFDVPEGEEITEETINELSNGKGEE